MPEFRPIFLSLLHQKGRSLLLIFQIALTLAITSNTFNVVQTSLERINRDTGMPDNEIFNFSISTSSELTSEEQLQIILDTIALVKSIPGVINASIINAIPLSGSGTGFPFKNGDQISLSALFSGSETILDTLGVELIAGRNFNAEDVIRDRNETNSVTIITQALAEQLYPQGDALGKTITDAMSMDLRYTIIGIIKHMQGPWLSAEHVNHSVIIPAEGSTFSRFLVRTEAESRNRIMGDIEALLVQNNGDIVFNGMSSNEELLNESYAPDKLFIAVLLSISLVLLIITAMSILGIGSYNVIQRTFQIGVRRALGARKYQIVGYFMVEYALLAFIGLALGSVLALQLSRLILANFSMHALSLSLLSVSCLFIYLVGQASVLHPALNAAKISPAIATRSD